MAGLVVNDSVEKLWSAYDKGQLTLSELYICLDEVSESNPKPTQREMQAELAKVIGAGLASVISDFYLIYAYRKLKEGKSIENVRATALQRKKKALINTKRVAMNNRWAETFSN